MNKRIMRLTAIMIIILVIILIIVFTTYLANRNENSIKKPNTSRVSGEVNTPNPPTTEIISSGEEKNSDKPSGEIIVENNGIENNSSNEDKNKDKEKETKVEIKTENNNKGKNENKNDQNNEASNNNEDENKTSMPDIIINVKEENKQEPVITSDINTSNQEKQQVLNELDDALQGLLEVVSKVPTVDEQKLDASLESEVQP